MKLLADEIERNGPIRFSTFMQTALYHPEFGYYRSDPFGREGDFYTAEQLQPVFGRLIASYIRTLGCEEVVELGAGRAEMTEAFAEFRYLPLDIGYGSLPENFRGVVFSNEFFDAIPVDVFSGSGEEVRVGFDGSRFVWTRDVSGGIVESQSQRLQWLDRIAASLDEGYVVTIDYGYTRQELVRFPHGTLMSYRKHVATNEVLDTPGERDITAHVDFTALMAHGESLGLKTLRFETLASFLLSIGEMDEFRTALDGESEVERLKLKLQLKTLLFGMGETFRVLVQQK